MMKFKCYDCKAVFDEEDAHKECCPYCGGDDLEEVFECEMCGEVHFDYEITNGICEECLMREAENIRQTIEYGAEDEDNGEVTINAFWAYVYTPDEIDDILTADFMKLSEAKQKEFAKKYVDNDPYMFADWLKERASE